MSSLGIKNIEQAKKLVIERNLDFIKIGVFDYDGILRGKYVNREKFFSALEHNFGFCDVILGWDSNDQLIPNLKYTGWHTGYPDAMVRIIPESCRNIAGEDTVLFLGEFVGEAKEYCPRGILKSTLKLAQEMGFQARAALEYEFFLFDETPDSIREKGYQNLKPITPGNFGYSVLRNSTHAPLYQELFELCRTMDFPLEGLHTETGPGVWEAAIRVDDLMAAADKAALFKTFVKVWAQKHGMMATFMARWSIDYPGQSGHMHLSLQNQNGESAFYDQKHKYGMTEVQEHFVSGQQILMPEFLAMIAPTVNSYSRLVPGFWAPTASNWGFENRTCSLRVISGSPKSQRVEYRLGAADANPYFALAAALGSGMLGVQEKWPLIAETKGNAYDKEYNECAMLPKSLKEATQLFSNSTWAKKLWGENFVSHYSTTRLWEESEYQKHISDWELKRYFEII